MATQEPTTNVRTDENTELSKERTSQGADRTQLAWIRTCLTLIGFGFGIDVIGESLESSLSDTLTWSARVMGLGFVLLAIVAAIVAMLQYRELLEKIEHGGFHFKPSFSLALAVTATLILMGLFAGAAIVVSATLAFTR